MEDTQFKSLESQVPLPNLSDGNHIVFQKVVKYLDLKTKVKCQLVCIQWRDIVKDELDVYQTVISSWNSQNNSFEHDQYKPSQYNYVGNLLNTDKDYDNFKLLLSKFPNLKCIYIKKDPTDVIYFKTLVENCPKLEHIFLNMEIQTNFMHYPFENVEDEIMKVGNLLGNLKIKSFGFDHEFVGSNYDKTFALLTSEMKYLENVFVNKLVSIENNFLSNNNNIKQIFLHTPYAFYNFSDLFNCICNYQMEKFNVLMLGLAIQDYLMILSKFPNLNDLTIFDSQAPFEELNQSIAKSKIKKLNYKSIYLLENTLFTTPLKSIEEINIDTLFLPKTYFNPLNDLSFYCENLKRISLKNLISGKLTGSTSTFYQIYRKVFEEISKLNNLQYLEIFFSDYSIPNVNLVGAKENFNREMSEAIFTSFKCPQSLITMKIFGLELNLNGKKLIDSWFEYVKNQPKKGFIFVLKEKSGYLNSKMMPNNFKINFLDFDGNNSSLKIA